MVGSQTSQHQDATLSPERASIKHESSASSNAPYPQEEYIQASNSQSHSHSHDLEKAETSHSLGNSNLNRRISRVESLRRGSIPGRFSHPLSHVKTSEANVVDFDGADDPYRPLNWPFRKKCITTLLYGLTTFGSTWASAVYAPAVEQIRREFDVGREVGLLGVTLLLLGFGFGPLVFAPVSEIYGRKPGVLLPYFLAACFSFATATAKDIQTILITRFFAGFFGSAPVTNTGGVLADIWSPRHRGTAIVAYAGSVVMGPTLAPIVGAAITNSYLRWRWTEYITGIIMVTMFIIDIIVLDESYPPILLVNKARRLRHETGNWALHAKHEEWDVSFKELVIKFGARPFQLLLTPICFLIALYASFVYGILYLQLASIPIAFGEVRHWGPVTQQLPFLALLCGIILGGGANVMNNNFYIKKYEANGNKAVPEARLPPMMAGGISFAAGMFIFAWTSQPDIFPAGQIVGLVMVGFGFFTIFQAALNYLIDTFHTYGASAVAANTFLRSVLAAVFPLFVHPMYNRLQVHWASTVIACVGACMIPIPFFFYVYGPSIRKKGKYTKSLSA